MSHTSLTIAIQGQAASFHDQAAHLLVKEPFDLIYCDTFDDVFDEVRSEHADYGVVAIFNSHAGHISDPGGVGEPNVLLAGEPVEVLSTIEMPIQQCVVGLQESQLSTITDVYSHPAALEQARKFLAEQLPDATTHQTHDTAGAVADIIAWDDLHKAAIASRYAAEHYNARVLAESIQNDSQNLTRFVLFRKVTL